MVPLGLSAAAAVVVGHAVGRGDREAAREAARRAALYRGRLHGRSPPSAFLVLPGPLARLYTDAPEVLAVAVVLIPLAGVFQVFDGIQVTSIGLLRGLGDTRTPMLTGILGFWLVGLPVSLFWVSRLGSARPGSGGGWSSGWSRWPASSWCVSGHKLRQPLRRVHLDAPEAASSLFEALSQRCDSAPSSSTATPPCPRSRASRNWPGEHREEIARLTAARHEWRGSARRGLRPTPGADPPTASGRRTDRRGVHRRACSRSRGDRRATASRRCRGAGAEWRTWPGGPHARPSPRASPTRGSPRSKSTSTRRADYAGFDSRSPLARSGGKRHWIESAGGGSAAADAAGGRWRHRPRGPARRRLLSPPSPA